MMMVEQTKSGYTRRRKGPGLTVYPPKPEDRCMRYIDGREKRKWEAKKFLEEAVLLRKTFTFTFSDFVYANLRVDERDFEVTWLRHTDDPKNKDKHITRRGLQITCRIPQKPKKSEQWITILLPGCCLDYWELLESDEYKKWRER
jgi:hypothetical protein